MRKHILFVDDNEDDLTLAMRALKPQQLIWQTTCVASGEAALAALSKTRIDALVVDCNMPGIDGVQLLEHAARRAPRVARIMLSGTLERAAALRPGGIVQAFLSKPLAAGGLRDAIARLCHRAPC